MNPQNVAKLEGRLTVERAAQLSEILKETIDHSDRVVVDCSGATDMDVSFLQILYAADRSCALGNKEFSLAGRCPEVMRQALRRAGFCHAGDSCEDAPEACLWKRP
jgi:anti-anti-sigma regulatory factor